MKRTQQEMFIQVMNIIREERFYSVDRIAKDLKSNWKTIDNVCNILKDLQLIEIKILGKTKVVALK